MVENDDMLVETTFSPYLWIDNLTDESLYNEIKKVGISYPKKESNLWLIRGYEFILIASLYEFVDSVIRSPEALDLPFDEGLKDAWSSIRNRGRDSLIRLVRRNSSVSYVFHSINTYWNELLRATSWEELDSIRITLSDWSRNIRRGFRFAYKCRTTQHQLRKDPEIVLRAHAFDWLWPHMVHFGLLSGIYSDVYSKKLETLVDNNIPDDWERDDQLPSTRFSEPGDLSFPKHPPESWASGYVLSLRLLIQRLDSKKSPDIIKLDGKLKDISNWRDLDKLGRTMPLSFKASRKTHITKIRPFPKSSLRNIMFPVKRGFKANQLLGIMGSPLRIIESDTLSAPFNLERLLEGSITIAKRHKEKIRVINLLHKKAHYPTAHSLAIFMPVYTWISNWSTWWVFFDLYYDYERGEDTESARIREIVTGMLSRLNNDIEMEEYPISKEELLSMAEEPGFVYLKDELAHAKNVNWDIRGALPEIIGAEYFGAMDYHPIRVNMKPGFLNGKELDVVAIKWGKNLPVAFSIIESTGYSVSSDKELQEQIDKFSEKILVIRKHRKQLANEMGIQIAPRKILATFISMSDTRHLKLRIPKNIEIWNFEDFINELKNNQIPTWHLRLLRQSSVALTIAFGEGIQKAIFDEK